MWWSNVQRFEHLKEEVVWPEHKGLFLKASYLHLTLGSSTKSVSSVCGSRGDLCKTRDRGAPIRQWWVTYKNLFCQTGSQRQTRKREVAWSNQQARKTHLVVIFWMDWRVWCVRLGSQRGGVAVIKAEYTEVLKGNLGVGLERKGQKLEVLRKKNQLDLDLA